MSHVVVTVRPEVFVEDALAKEVVDRRSAGQPVPAYALLPWTRFAEVATRLNARVEGKDGDRFTVHMPGARVVVMGSEMPSPGTMLLVLGGDAIGEAMKEVDRAIDGERCAQSETQAADPLGELKHRLLQAAIFFAGHRSDRAIAFTDLYIRLCGGPFGRPHGLEQGNSLE